MSKNNHDRNVSGLLSHAIARSEATAGRIDAAIRTLISQGAPVNFNAIATLAQVSKTTLYNNPNLRARIEHLRRSTSSVPQSAKKRAISDKGKDVILAAKNKRINELEAEVKRLSDILQRCYANEYEKY